MEPLAALAIAVLAAHAWLARKSRQGRPRQTIRALIAEQRTLAAYRRGDLSHEQAEADLMRIKGVRDA